MKLIVAIIDDRDIDQVMTELTSQHIGVTRVSSTGGLLVPGNSTLLIGVDEQQVSPVMTVIADLASPRQSFVPYTLAASTGGIGGFTEIPVGGFMSFVLNIDSFEQV